jgi:hypothetical protein
MDSEKSRELIEDFITCLSGRLDSGIYEVTHGRVEKLTGSYDSVLIMNKETGVGANIDIRQIICQYEQGYCLQQIAENVRERLAEEVLSLPVSHEWIMQYEKVRDLLFVRLSSRREHAELLAYTPHKDLPGDLAATVHIYVEVEEGFGSIIVSGDLLKAYGKTFDELFEEAVENSQRILPAEINTLSGVVGLPEQSAECTGIVLTNNQQINGSAVILYPGVLEQVSQQFHEDYWLFPSSIHEMIGFRVSAMTKESAYEILHSANRTVVSPNELLSDVLYCYHHETGTLEAVEENS